MRIAVIGTGAMGSLFAARLSEVADVIMVGNWAQQLEAVRKGLTLIAPDGKRTVHNIAAATGVKNIDPVDMALVLVKSYHTAGAAAQADVLLSEDSPLNVALTLQNGAGNLEKMEAILGASRILGGVTSQAATLVAPGIVRDTGPGAIYLANMPQQEQKIEMLSEMFRKAGFRVEHSADIRSLIWGKLIVNAAINPLTAIFNRPNGYIAENRTARQLMSRLVREAAAVAAAQHITLPYADAEQEALEISRATADNQSSMLRDALRGARTEIDAICGEVIEKGKRYDVPTPINSIIFDLIKAIESGRRKPETVADLSWILRQEMEI
ncbi:MAG: 2-dehydropantoate 2-reductase [Sinomicrobium sp.]|nr:2-dehydropantoate 2-reductase [Sinomicrobium sp.]